MSIIRLTRSKALGAIDAADPVDRAFDRPEPRQRARRPALQHPGEPCAAPRRAEGERGEVERDVGEIGGLHGRIISRPPRPAQLRGHRRALRKR